MGFVMSPYILNRVKEFLKNEDGVSAIEYCAIFGGVAFLIIFAGLNAVGPAISDRLGNAFEPNAGVMPSAKSSGGGCKSNGWTGNCGIGLGNGGGNGTANEGNGKGPGEEKEKDADEHPRKGHK
jgi:Flp pilus assembly pilin Flp